MERIFIVNVVIRIVINREERKINYGYVHSSRLNTCVSMILARLLLSSGLIINIIRSYI